MAIVEDLPDSPVPKTRGSARARKSGNRSGRRKTTVDEGDVDEIPLIHPSVVRDSSSSPLLSVPDLDLPAGDVYTLKPGQELPPTLSRQTGLAEQGGEEDDDEVFNTLIMVVPFTFLYLLLDILVHLQYSHRPDWEVLVKHVVTAAPTLYMIILYTNRHPTHFATTSLLMSASLLSGCRLIWLVNKASWSVVTAQAPPMGTLWILTIVQLPLSRAVIALLAVGGWLKYSGLELIP